MNEVIALKNATKIIPIEMMSVGSDPVETGLVQSVADPGGNITGVAALATQLSTKRMERLKEIIPGAARVPVLYDPAIRAIYTRCKIYSRLQRVCYDLLLSLWRYELRRIFKRICEPAQAASRGSIPAGRPANGCKSETNSRLCLKERSPSTYERREAVEVGGQCPTDPTAPNCIGGWRTWPIRF
jgi:hypothetical protein